MTYPVSGEALRYVRDQARMSQTQLAKAMGTVASVLSKLEKLDEVEAELAQRYLNAVDTPLAREALDHYGRNWRRSTPPSFLHPDREALWLFDIAARDLDVFEAERKDPILRGHIDLLREDLRAAETYLDRRDHTVAWIGDIGVGKTTALSHAVGLLVGDGRSGRRPAFPVGPGRTTVCETAIRVGPYGVLVDPMEEEQVVRLARDLVASLAPDAAGIAVPAELARLIRAMADMKVTSRVDGDEVVTIDPIADLLASGIGIAEVADRVVAGMNLSDRTERQLIQAEGSEDGLTWISRLVSAINSGTDPRFSVPTRITVLMPSDRLKADGQILSVIDTRGVEGVTQRKDISQHAEEIRTLMVLCTKFADAPNATVQRHLQDSYDAGTGAADRHRQCILVLPRGDEALETPGPNGPVSNRLQGYAVRRAEVRQALVGAGLPPTPTYFFDARNDDPDQIWSDLRAQIQRMRNDYAARGRAAAAGVRNLIENVDDVRASEARMDIEVELARLLGEVGPLMQSVRPPHQNLIEQLAVGHHSSIAASIYRRGDWENFAFDHILGMGVRIDANLRTQRDTHRLEFRFKDFETKYHDLESVLVTIQSLRIRLSEGRQEFLSAARLIGADAYGRLLAGADLWPEAAKRYGMGSGYKRDVAELWRAWFETTPEAQDVRVAVDARLQDAWSTWVIEPLRQAVRAAPTP